MDMGRRSTICRVLIVDDDESVLRACARSMSTRVQLFTATNAADAITIVKREQLDSAIVDWVLGKDDGIDLVREIRNIFPDLAILVWSGYASTETTVAAMRAGADDVRQKPIPADLLIGWLEKRTWNGALGATMTATLDRMKWEYVHRIVTDCSGNISEAARRLGIERATLRRYLLCSAPLR